MVNDLALGDPFHCFMEAKEKFLDFAKWSLERGLDPFKPRARMEWRMAHAAISKWYLPPVPHNPMEGWKND